MDQAHQTSQPVEGEQLAQAAANILKTEEFVPRNKRWGFSRSSKAHKDYERIVQDVTVRRRSARVRAFDERLKQERAAAEAAFETAKASAELRVKPPRKAITPGASCLITTINWQCR